MLLIGFRFSKSSICLSLVLVIYFCIANSCGLIKVNGTLQGLTSYYVQSKKICPELFDWSIETNMGQNLLIDTFRVNKLMIGNGNDVKQHITKYQHAIVYIWSPKCKSKYCESLDLLQQKCSKASVELVVVAEYYDCSRMLHSNKLKRPIVGIDTKYYQSNFTRTYIKRFLKDLTVDKHTAQKAGRFFYFNQGQLVSRVKSIDSLPVIRRL